MASIVAEWWGLRLGLSHQEACFISSPSFSVEQLANLIPPPWGQMVAGVIVANKTWIRNNVGTSGEEIHLNWAGIIHWVGRRGAPSGCSDASLEATAETGSTTSGGQGPMTHFPVPVMFEQTATADLTFPTTPLGNVFRVEESFWEPSLQQGQFWIHVTNNSGEPIAVEVIREEGVEKTGRIASGAQGSTNNVVSAYKGQQNRIIRWRPGLFGIWGSGGGELVFTIPDEAGHGHIRLTVVG